MCASILGVFTHVSQTPVSWLQFDIFTGSLISAGDDGNCVVWSLQSLLSSSGDQETVQYPVLSLIETSDIQLNTSIDRLPFTNSYFGYTRNDTRAGSNVKCLRLPHIRDRMSGDIVKILTFDVSK